MYKMIRSLISIFFLIISLFSNAQSNNSTQINFKIKNFGSYVNGSFSDVNVDSNLDLNNIDESYINGEIAVKSIDTNNKKRDNHLRSEDYFEVSIYPKIILTSTKIKKISDEKFILIAKLTIKKTTRTVEIPIEINQDNDDLKMIAKFDINRRDYSVGGKSWVLSNEVKIEVIHTIAQ